MSFVPGRIKDTASFLAVRANEGKIIFLREATLSVFISVLTKKLNRKQMFLEATS